MKENGGIFCHTQGWAVIAETLLGNGDLALQYFRASMPSAFNNLAEVREIEPYVYSQSTHGKYSPRHGASRVPWLTGAATWAYYAATQYLFGIQPDYEGLRIDPCIPASWEGFRTKRRFRGKYFEIEVSNPQSVQKGVTKLTVNGEVVNGNLIPVEIMQPENKVEVVMG